MFLTCWFELENQNFKNDNFAKLFRQVISTSYFDKLFRIILIELSYAPRAQASAGLEKLLPVRKILCRRHKLNGFK